MTNIVWLKRDLRTQDHEPFKLASDGVRFTQSYSTYPLCTPARASLFTGLYSHNNDVGFNLKKDSILDQAEIIPTLGKTFKDAGYNVAYFGKEHAGGYGYASATEFGSMMHSNGGMLAEGSAYDPIFTEDAIQYVQDQKGDKPFFMTLSLINPHDICSCLLYTSPSPRDLSTSRMPSSA